MQTKTDDGLIEIDGGHMEAGGAILRVATGLSIYTRKPFHIFNIRKGRPEPGLKPQHLTGIKASAEICNAKIENAKLGGTELTFYPSALKPGSYSFDVGTAGSISLVLQSLMISCTSVNGSFSFDITGGTDVSWSPSISYFTDVFSYWLKRMGCTISTQVQKYGFYPKGGGSVKVDTAPINSLKALNTTKKDKLIGINATSIASESLRQSHVAERQIKSAENILGQNFSNKSILYSDTLCAGSSINIVAEYSNCVLGAGSLGEKSKSAEKVGEEAAKLLKTQTESNACLDRWTADQILPYLAIAAVQTKRQSEITVTEMTNHARTNIWVIEKFLPVKFVIEEKKQSPHIIVNI